MYDHNKFGETKQEIGYFSEDVMKSANEPLLHTDSHLQGTVTDENGWRWSSSDPLTYYNWERKSSVSADHGFCAALNQATGKREKSLL